eukprot:3484118-Rhodomonas_salina.1
MLQDISDADHLSCTAGRTVALPGALSAAEDITLPLDVRPRSADASQKDQRRHATRDQRAINCT